MEITNSNPDRIVPANDFKLNAERGDCVWITAPHSKVINCILHDGGEGAFPQQLRLHDSSSTGTSSTTTVIMRPSGSRKQRRPST